MRNGTAVLTHSGVFLCFAHDIPRPAHTKAEVRDVKEEEKKPVPWEASDPKLPVVQSGHMENHRHYGKA